SLSDYQEDHLISLELGGHPTDPRNLWPEPYPRASEVDSIENDLNARVCARELSLDDAQRKESELKHIDGCAPLGVAALSAAVREGPVARARRALTPGP